jgi:hypothetical protein
MKYLALIYHDETQWEKLTPDESGKIYADYMRVINELTAGGKYLGGSQLKPTSSATTVRIRDGKRAVTDGPFAETKEQFGGYLLLEASDLDEAIDIASKIPGARYGSIEVRPQVAREQAKSA